MLMMPDVINGTAGEQEENQPAESAAWSAGF
jgi:hypothetical protein